MAVGSIVESAFASGENAPHLEHNLSIAIIESRDLRVRRLLVVVIDILAPGGEDALRQSSPEPPSRDVHLMHTLVADVSVARVPEPMPVVLESKFVVRPHRRRS